MSKIYTFNQTMAIACLFASSIWGLTAQAVAIMLGTLQPVYTLGIIVLWILLIFYIKSIRQAFPFGIFFLAIVICYLVIIPSLFGRTAWYMFTRGLFDFTYAVFYLISIAGIYFSYKSWKELQKK